MRRQSRFLLVSLALFFLGAAASDAAIPDWAKPYVNRPVPQGSFVGDSEWVALYSEVEIGLKAAGRLRRTYRQVLAPMGDQERSLVLAVRYDAALQELRAPQVWVRGSGGTRQLKLSKSTPTLSMPRPSAVATTSLSIVLTSTGRLAPEERAILEWEVSDREPLLVGDVLWPFDDYPAAELVVRASPAPAAGPRPRIFWVEPGEGDGGPHRP